MRPPPTPIETLARVVRRARFNGGLVMAIAGCFALMSAAGRDYLMAGIALLAAGAGAVERHGGLLLDVRDARGTSWLVASQLYLLFLVLVYSLWRIAVPDHGLMTTVAAMLQRIPSVQSNLRGAGVSQRELLALLRKVYYLTYMILAVATFLYQGSLAIYYHRRRPALESALATIAPR